MSRLWPLCFLVFSFSLYAKKIQIIHTNDLHSYYMGFEDSQAGYARVKTLIDKLKLDASLSGIDSIVLDGGDFGEGAHYFLYNEGLESFKLMGDLGVDAAVIGNHDFMFGGNHLGKSIREANVRTEFLGANILHTTDMRLSGVLKPSARFEVDGVKLEVIGLTTNSLHFMHAIRPGIILPPTAVSRAYSKIARLDNMDLVVALTHIGVDSDVKLVKKDPNIDIVIGGHSHTKLEQVKFQKNSEGRSIPIVQTGAHGMAVGSLIINVDGPKNFEVLSYQLHNTQGEVQDINIQNKVEQINIDSEHQLGNGRWGEVIGESEIDLNGYDKGTRRYDSTCWVKDHLGEIIRHNTPADVSLYLGTFLGRYIPPGQITYGDIIKQFPHVSDFKEPGWEIMYFNIKGYQLYAIVSAIINITKNDFVEKDIILGGIDYKTRTIPNFIPWVGGKKVITGFRIKDKKFKFRSIYKIALPYELSLMIDKLLPSFLRKYIPTKFKRGEHFLWPMAEDYIRDNSPLRCK